MEAHRRLMDAGFRVSSYGIATKVKIPGPTVYESNVFAFGTPFHVIKKVLQQKDSNLYLSNGLIELCERNELIKKAPQKWQLNLNNYFDVAITFEKYVFDQVLNHLDSKNQSRIKFLLIINVEVRDSVDEALEMGNHILKLCENLEKVFIDLEEKIDSVIEEFEKLTGRSLLYTIIFN